MYATQLSTSYMMPAEGVSALKAAADTCHAATAFARNDVGNAVTEWWTQPAVNAVPWLTCGFRLFILFGYVYGANCCDAPCLHSVMLSLVAQLLSKFTQCLIHGNIHTSKW